MTEPAQEEAWSPQSALEAEEGRYKGRYFPYSGGSAGWFENAGVPRRELANNYLFYTALDTAQCLQKRFERLGAELSRRRNQRILAQGIPVSLQAGEETLEGTIHDFSDRGVRLRLPGGAGLSVGQHVALRVQPSTFFKTELALIDGEIKWLADEPDDDGAWHVGLEYRGV